MDSYEDPPRRGTYYLQLNRGGPAIDLMMTTSRSFHGQTRLGVSDLSYATRYVACDGSHEFPAPAEIKQAHAAMCDTIRNLSKSVTVGKARLRMFPSVENLVRDGGLVLHMGQYLDLHGISRGTPNEE